MRPHGSRRGSRLPDGARTLYSWQDRNSVPEHAGADLGDEYGRARRGGGTLRPSRIVVFSTGCVYALSSVSGDGLREVDPLGPPGEYANTCVGRERIFTHFSQQFGTAVLLFRLNYAIDLRYGVLLT